MKTSTPEGWKKTFAQTLRDDGALLLDEDDARLNSAGASLIAAAHKIESLSAQLAKADAELSRALKVGADEPDEPASAAAPAPAKCRHEFGDDGVCKKCSAKRSRKPRAAAAQQPLPAGGGS